MKRNYKLASLALGLLSVQQAIAGGVILYEIGTDDVGLAAAGYSARAQDPSTILTNPAGMTRLAGNQMLAGVQALYQDVRFTPKTVSPFLGSQNGGNPVGVFPGGSFFYSHTVNDFLKAGIGIYGNFGSSLSYDDDWVGRYSVVSATLLGVTIQPTLALQLEHGLSLGFGVMFMNGVYSNKVAINNSPFGVTDFPDGQLKISDNDWGVGANVGLLYEPTSCTRFGITYQSPVKLNFSSTTRFSDVRPILNTLLLNTGLLDGAINIGLEVPQGSMLSLFHQMTDQWAVLFSAGWQNWKKFGLVEIGVDSVTPRTLVADLKYKDTWHAALGLQHAMNEKWLVNMGIGYDTNFQNPDKVSVTTPVNSALRIGLGTRYAYRNDLDLGVAVEYISGGNLDVDSHGLVKGDLVGTFEDTAVYFLSINANWKCV